MLHSNAEPTLGIRPRSLNAIEATPRDIALIGIKFQDVPICSQRPELASENRIGRKPAKPSRVERVRQASSTANHVSPARQ